MTPRNQNVYEIYGRRLPVNGAGGRFPVNEEPAAGFRSTGPAAGGLPLSSEKPTGRRSSLATAEPPAYEGW